MNLFLYDKPRLATEREHNKTVTQKAEATRAKQLLEHESSRHGLDDRTKLSASFFEYFDQLTFDQIDKRFLEGFRHYLQHEATTKSATKLAKNTTRSYFNKVRVGLNQA